MRILQQSTAVTVTIGPFLSNTDFKTPQTTLVSSSGNLIIFAGGFSGDISTNSFAHLFGGVYSLGLTVGNTSALGSLQVEGLFPTAVPIAHEFMVSPANFYAAAFGTGSMGVNASAIAGSAAAATQLADGALAVVPGTCQAGSSSTTINTNLTSTTSANYNGRTIVFYTGALAGQAASITGYNGSTFQLTVTALTGAPNAGDLFVIV